MRPFFLFVTSRPLPVLAAAALLALVLLVLMLGIERDPSPDAFIPLDHPALARKERVEKEFGVTEPLVVAVFRDAPGGVFVPKTLRLIRDLSHAIQQLPQVDPGDVLSLATESGVYFDEGVPGFERLMKNVPETPDALEELKKEILGYELYRGTLVAEDGSAATILVRSAGVQADDELYRRLSQLVEEIPHTDERIVVAGEAAVRAHMGVAVSDDGLRMNFICPVLMALLIFLAYRTGRGTLLPLCVIGGSAAMALGLMSAADLPVYIITNGIFVIIMALGVADSMHLVGQYYEEQLEPRGRSKQEIIVDACMALWYPLLATSLTDIAGFMALYFAGIMPPIRYFGLFTCVGIAGALLYSFTVVPAGLMILPLGTSRAFVRRGATSADPKNADLVGRAMGRLGSLAFYRRRRVLLVAAALLILSLWGASKLVVNDARILAFADEHPIAEASRAINERFDGTSHLNVVITPAQEGALLHPEMLQSIANLEAFTETLPHVGGTHSIAGWVKRAHQKMHDEDPAFYAIPQDPSDTQFYLDVLSTAASPMSRLLLEVTDETYTRANLIIRVKSSEYVHYREIIPRLQRHLDETFAGKDVTALIAGRADLDYHWLSIVRKSHIRSVVFSFLAVLLITGLMFRSVVAGLLCTMTVGAAVLLNYALMGFGGISLGVGTSMFASIAIGAGVDFPIHVLDRLRASLRAGTLEPAEVFRTTFSFTGRALFFTAMVVTLGFALLIISELRTLNRFGVLIASAMSVTFFASVLLLPAVVAVLKPRFLWPGKDPYPTAGKARAQEEAQQLMMHRETHP